MTPDTEPASPVAPPRKKPNLSFLLATCFGLGYLPKAPGTWGSLGGVVLVAAIPLVIARGFVADIFVHDHYVPAYSYFQAMCCLTVAVVGVWSSSRVSGFSNKK